MHLVGSYYTDTSRYTYNITLSKQFHVVRHIKASLWALASSHQHTSKDEVVRINNAV